MYLYCSPFKSSLATWMFTLAHKKWSVTIAIKIRRILVWTLLQLNLQWLDSAVSFASGPSFSQHKKHYFTPFFCLTKRIGFYVTDGCRLVFLDNYGNNVQSNTVSDPFERSILLQRHYNELLHGPIHKTAVNQFFWISNYTPDSNSKFHFLQAQLTFNLQWHRPYSATS